MKSVHQFERMATDEEIARIREELQMRDAGTSKHAHWCSVLLRATWRRVQVVDAGGKKLALMMRVR